MRQATLAWATFCSEAKGNMNMNMTPLQLTKEEECYREITLFVQQQRGTLFTNLLGVSVSAD